MAIDSTLLSAFAPPSTRLSDKVRNFLDELELSQDAHRLLHMRTGRHQLETFLQTQHKEAATFEQVLERDSLKWEQHVMQARGDKDVKVQDRHVLPELLPGLTLVHDIKVGRRGRPDDAVYLKSPYARQWLPRGNCIAQWKAKNTTYFFPLVRGYRKFTGQEDDGDLMAQTESDEEKQSIFFTKPQAQSKWVIETKKENGEAGHLAVLKRSDGEFVYVLGSKNTHLLAQTLEDIDRARDYQKQVHKTDTFCAAAIIATAILRMVFALVPAKQTLLCEFLWQTRATASFEVLCPSHQHVEHLGYLNEDTPVFYGLSLMTLNSLEGADICVNPVLLYEFMDALGVRTVKNSVVKYNADDLKVALELTKWAKQHEGDVYLFSDEDAAVIGMLKHKSIWYICLRAIREQAKKFCRTLASIKPPQETAKPMPLKNEALKKAKTSMQKRFQAIQKFMRISNEVSNAYKALGEQFIKYLFEEELFRGIVASEDEREKCKQVARDIADLFPIVWKRFLVHTSLIDAISNTHR